MVLGTTLNESVRDARRARTIHVSYREFKFGDADAHLLANYPSGCRSSYLRVMGLTSMAESWEVNCETLTDGAPKCSAWFHGRAGDIPVFYKII